MKNFSFIDNIMENPTIKEIVKPVKKLFNKNKKKKKKINEYEKQFGLILNDMDNSYDSYATINDMNYNVVKSKDFVHNNMVKNTSRRDTGINYSNIDRKNGLFKDACSIIHSQLQHYNLLDNKLGYRCYLST